MSTESNTPWFVDLEMKPESLQPYLDTMDKMGTAYHFVRTDFKDNPGGSIKLEMWSDGADQCLTVCLHADGTWDARKAVVVEP